ncbi:S9 family peptidase [Natronosporangium hydrolyticum]|uniref:S9 family peptidase n=1 Tax=Natronosporangium hydrolyticum TaxID=2811111 RepID=A0A895YA58_9ACTN|nr:S9 family peptidase [Natronosporangium hydrolyticum]QSB14654.1 S9 family peptidase [Natronosporangium hydrolyticum]
MTRYPLAPAPARQPRPGRRPTAADFAGLAEPGPPVLSPDGRWVTFAVTRPAEAPYASIWLAPADGGEKAEPVAAQVALASPLCFDPESRHIGYLTGDGATRWLTRLSLAGLPASESEIVLPEPVTGTGTLAFQPGGGQLVALLRTHQVGRLWRIDPDGGAAHAASPDGLDVLAFTLSPAGNRAAVVARPTAGQSGQLSLIDLATGELTQTLHHRVCAPTTRDQTLDWSPDGTAVLFSRAGASGGHEPAVADLASGAVRPIRWGGPATVLAARWSGAGDRIVAQLFRRTTSVLVEQDLAGGPPRRLARARVGYPRFSHRRGRTAYLTSDADAAPDVWLRDPTTGARQLTDLNPQLRELRLGTVREISWRSSRDRTRVDGLLVHPPDAPDGPLPTVVNLHGGPHYHWCDGWHGSWVEWAQLLAGNGFAVLLPNPRGSTGRGWRYAHAVRGALGTLPLTDVLDGVDRLVADGVADPDRLGIGGWSYGGYLTAWAITQTTRFAAAVVGAGISEVASFLDESPMGPVWRGFFPGASRDRTAGYAAASPLTHLHRCRTPTLVVHGEQDRKIPVEQARRLHHGLREQQVPTELITLPGEGHTLTSVAARTRLLDSTLGWFAHQLGVAGRRLI